MEEQLDGHKGERAIRGKLKGSSTNVEEPFFHPFVSRQEGEPSTHRSRLINCGSVVLTRSMLWGVSLLQSSSLITHKTSVVSRAGLEPATH
jgi:hypothetical protein